MQEDGERTDDRPSPSFLLLTVAAWTQTMQLLILQIACAVITHISPVYLRPDETAGE